MNLKISAKSITAVVAVTLTAAAVVPYMSAQTKNEKKSEVAEMVGVLDNIIGPTGKLDEVNVRARVDSIPEEDISTRYSGLTDEDFELVASELNIEIAAIKAVVEIEAGKQMRGFWAPGVPVINFDQTMYSRFRRKNKSAGVADAKVPEGLSGYGLREWTQYIKARKVNSDAAALGTFWGMFQIGGFNYRKCGCETIDEYIRLMSYSELEQLELFAAFITNTGMLADLRQKNWAAFARKYNGPSYRKRGYHTKMATAYNRYSAKTEQQDKKP